MRPRRHLMRLLWLTCLLCGCALRMQAQRRFVAVPADGPRGEMADRMPSRGRSLGHLVNIILSGEQTCELPSNKEVARGRTLGHLANIILAGERTRDGLAAVVQLPADADAALLPEAWSWGERCAPRHGGQPGGRGWARQCGRLGVPALPYLCVTPPQGGIKSESQEAQPPAVAGADYVLRLRRLLC